MGKHAELLRRARLPEQLRVPGAVVLAAALFLACGQLKPPPVLDHVPASALTLAIMFDEGPKFDGAHFSNTQVVVTVNTFSDGRAIALSSEQKLTCNGVMLSNSGEGVMAAVVDSQPVGGSYDFIYTDEQGRRTTFSVPAIAPLKLISPAADTAVAIPRPVALVPTPTPGMGPPGARTPNLAHVPLTVRYALPSLPLGAEGTVWMDAQCTALGKLSGCGVVLGGVHEPAMGKYAISDASSAYSYGFETFVPGPGYITSTLRVAWEPATAFQSVKVRYDSFTETPIIWTAN